MVSTNLGNWIHFTYVFGIFLVAFSAIVAFNEPGMELRDGGFVLKAAVLGTVLFGALGIIGTLAGYMQIALVLTADVGLVIAAEDIRIIPLGEVASEALGYTDEEGLGRWRLGILWMSFATVAYIVTVVGGYLIMTISRVTSVGGRTDVPGEFHQAA